ncbi:MFS transporter [Cerasicoccus frondis]|uniref:MFS transporter n=1 Tax=Cerasicoccus frondis TaxID=490090 RepID=UPI0028526295|nr:MFS transporter [Cerasicoccus frondis]
MLKDRKQFIAGAIGNVLEWFDFAAYGFFASTIGQQFFPIEDKTLSLLAAFGVFASGFMARPLGAVFFGSLGDRKGREVVLRWSVILMGLSTFALGVLPNYQAIGLAAPVLLTLLRMLQGFSVGGEFTGSIIYLVENAPPGRRGAIGVWAFVGGVLGMLGGSYVGALINDALTPEQLASWGWRLPFLGGISVMAVCLYFRRNLTGNEPESHTGRPPTWMAIKTDWRVMLKIMGMFLLGSAGFYMMFIYITTYTHEELGMPEGVSLKINSLAMLALVIFSIGWGWISDRVGRKPVLLFSSLGCLLFSYPLFLLIQHTTQLYVFLGQLGFALLIGATLGASTAVMVENTKATFRCSSVSMAYNLTMAIFGGTTPMVATWLIGESGNPLEPTFYLMGLAAVSTVAICFLPETHRLELDAA